MYLFSGLVGCPSASHFVAPYVQHKVIHIQPFQGFEVLERWKRLI
jgi:hypothetical protein